VGKGAPSRRAHHVASCRVMVGTPPDAFASGDFAHPTNLKTELRKMMGK
jgi:hypothetical protein